MVSVTQPSKWNTMDTLNRFEKLHSKCKNGAIFLTISFVKNIAFHGTTIQTSFHTHVENGRSFRERIVWYTFDLEHTLGCCT